MSDVAEVEMNSILANKKVDDELRRVSRPDLLRHISDDIESNVVDSLIKSVSEQISYLREILRSKGQTSRSEKIALS